MVLLLPQNFGGSQLGLVSVCAEGGDSDRGVMSGSVVTSGLSLSVAGAWWSVGVGVLLPRKEARSLHVVSLEGPGGDGKSGCGVAVAGVGVSDVGVGFVVAFVLSSRLSLGVAVVGVLGDDGAWVLAWVVMVGGVLAGVG